MMKYFQYLPEPLDTTFFLRRMSYFLLILSLLLLTAKNESHAQVNPYTPGVAAGHAMQCAMTDANATATCNMQATLEKQSAEECRVKCWGSYRGGFIGDDLAQLAPKIVSGLGKDTTVAIASGLNHACALNELGGVKCWGMNHKGQLGNGTRTDSNTPVDVIGLSSGIKAISAGGHRTCAVTTDGRVYCWGDDRALGALSYNQCQASTQGCPFPYLVTNQDGALLSSIASVVVGEAHNCALTVAGTIKCWGQNHYGQLGDGTGGSGWMSHFNYVDVIGIGAGVVQMAASGNHTCAINSSRQLMCWGLNDHGQLGIGNKTNKMYPVLVNELTKLTDLKAILTKVSESHSCVVMGVIQNLRAATKESETTEVASASKLLCWGNNEYGQLGDGTSKERLKPTEVTVLQDQLKSMITDLTVGLKHTSVVIINNMRRDSFFPSSISSLRPHPVAADSFTEGILSWGDNSSGQLGDGTRNTSFQPVGAEGLSSVYTYWSIRGQVFDAMGQAMTDVVVDAGDLGTRVTDSSGNFDFSGVPNGFNCTLTPTKAGYEFTPPTQELTVTTNSSPLFIGQPADTDDDGIPDADEEEQGLNPNSSDSDSDGTGDSQELEDGSDPLDPGSNLPVLGTELCSEWNGFLNMWNIMEHVNMSDNKLSVESKIYSITGSAGEVKNFSVKPGSQYDLLVHDLEQHIDQSYGKVCSKITGANAGDLDGRMVYYKAVDNGAGGYTYDFAFAMPFLNGKKGRQYVPYNTFQPSLDPADASNVVANWIQITNLGTTSKRGTMTFFDIAGTEIQSTKVSLPAGARQDLSGHDIAGAQKVGIIEWIPEDSEAIFQLRNVRYYYRPDGVSFDGAFQLEGDVGSGLMLTVPLDSAVGSSVIEVSNVLNQKVTVEITVYDQSGTQIEYKKLSLRAHQTFHLVADQILSNSSSKMGMATIKGSARASIVATAMQYGRTDTQGIKNIYGIQARQPLGATLRGSYNTFLNQGCRLRLVNGLEDNVTATISLRRYDMTQSEAQEVTVPMHGMVDYDLCSLEPKNTYGVVTVQPEVLNSIYANIIRIGESDQYRFPTPVRQ